MNPAAESSIFDDMDAGPSVSTAAAQIIDHLDNNCTCNTTVLDAAEHKVGALTEFFGSNIVAALVVGLLPTLAMTIGSLVR